jgi:hypothetical protein
MSILEGFRNDIKAHRDEEQRLLVGIELFGLEQRVYFDLTATQKDCDDLMFIWGMYPFFFLFVCLFVYFYLFVHFIMY